MTQTAPLLAATFEAVTATVQDCIDAGASTAPDAWRAAAVLWFALHGLVTVPQAVNSLDWPPFDQFLTDCVTRTVGRREQPA